MLPRDIPTAEATAVVWVAWVWACVSPSDCLKDSEALADKFALTALMGGLAGGMLLGG